MKTTTNFVWCRLESSCLGTDHDIIICGVYIPPHNSPYFSFDLFEELEKDISPFTSRGSILLLGDMNARTGKYNDFLDANDKEYLITDTQETSFTASPRNNCHNVLNNHGKLLLQICKNCDLAILNGRIKGDSLGNVTFHGRNGVSTVDYVICDQNLFQKIEFFCCETTNNNL